MLMVSIITIPLYKMVCNLSYMDQYITYFASNKEYLSPSFFNAFFVYMFDALSHVQSALLTLHTQNNEYSIFFYICNSCVNDVEHII